MRLSDLQSKKIIDIVSGTNIGNIVDISISDSGQVDYFVIDHGKTIFSLGREENTKIYWSQIHKIGEDVILVKKDSV